MVVSKCGVWQYAVRGDRPKIPDRDWKKVGGTKPMVAPEQTAATTVSEDLVIQGIEEPAIARYFGTMNAKSYGETAALFASDGALLAPFEEPIIGPEAIAQYLEAEALTMTLLPREGTCDPQLDGQRQVQVTGLVQTPFFGVNVGWIFILNPASEILAVRVKLLASPGELLQLRNQRERDGNHEKS
ncbi:MAG: ketosteroid isomerase family protein [Synechococcales bacterium]|nr:ketosteroid isomerase family protein [Synechococcales bacterium]